MSLRPTAVETTTLDDATGRFVEATLRVVARFGLAKLTLEDVAREAGASRATLYRHFPGKAALLDAVLAAETSRLRRGLEDALAGVVSLEEALVAAAHFGEAEWHDHEALQFLLAYEPGAVLPALCFDGGSRLLAVVSDAAAPALHRFLPPLTARRVAEWLARIVLSYGCLPSPEPAAAARVVGHFVVPAIDREVPHGA